MVAAISLPNDSEKFDFYSALAPVYALLKGIGLAQFNVTGSPGRRNVTLVNFLSCYKISFYVFILCVTFLIFLMNDVFWSFKAYNTLQRYIVLYEAHSTILLVFAMIITSSANRKTIMAGMERMMEIDTSLSKCGVVINDRFARNVNILWICFYSLTLAAGYVYAYVTKWQDLNFSLANSLYLITNIYKLSLGAIFNSWAFSITQRFEALNDRLSNSQETLQDKRLLIGQVQNTASIYQALYERAKELSFYGFVPTLMSLAINFSIFSIQSYHLAIALYRNEAVQDGSVVFALFWIFIYGIDMGVLILRCDSLKTQANLIKRQLLKLMIATDDFWLKREINSFSLQLLHTEVKITAVDFFTIDLSLIFTMVSAGSTYLIILIQFDLAFL